MHLSGVCGGNHSLLPLHEVFIQHCTEDIKVLYLPPSLQATGNFALLNFASLIAVKGHAVALTWIFLITSKSENLMFIGYLDALSWKILLHILLVVYFSTGLSFLSTCKRFLYFIIILNIANISSIFCIHTHFFLYSFCFLFLLKWASQHPHTQVTHEF